MKPRWKCEQETTHLGNDYWFAIVDTEHHDPDGRVRKGLRYYALGKERAEELVEYLNGAHPDA